MNTAVQGGSGGAGVAGVTVTQHEQHEQHEARLETGLLPAEQREREQQQQQLPARHTTVEDDEEEEEERGRGGESTSAAQVRAEKENKPTFMRIERKHISPAVLHEHSIPYIDDPDPNFLLITQWLPESELEELWRESSGLASSSEDATNESEALPLSPSPLTPIKELRSSWEELGSSGGGGGHGRGLPSSPLNEGRESDLPVSPVTPGGFRATGLAGDDVFAAGPSGGFGESREIDPAQTQRLSAEGVEGEASQIARGIDEEGKAEKETEAEAEQAKERTSTSRRRRSPQLHSRESRRISSSSSIDQTSVMGRKIKDFAWERRKKAIAGEEGGSVFQSFGQLQLLLIFQAQHEIVVEMERLDSRRRGGRRVLSGLVRGYVEALKDYEWTLNLSRAGWKDGEKYLKDVKDGFESLEPGYKNAYATDRDSLVDLSPKSSLDPVKRGLTKLLPRRLTVANAADSEALEEMEDLEFAESEMPDKPSMSESPLVAGMARFVLALVVGAFLLVPVIVMTFVRRDHLRLLVAALFILLFSGFVAVTLNRASSWQVLCGVGAYAGVLMIVLAGMEEGLG